MHFPTPIVVLALISAPAAQTKSRKADELFKQGLRLRNTDKPKAIDYFTRALTANPEHPTARYDRALVLAELDRAEEAVRDLRDLEQRQSPYAARLRSLLLGVAGGYVSMATRAIDERRYDLAREKLRVALIYDPDDADTHVVLGLLHGAEGRTDAEIAAYDRALALRPDSAVARCNRGLAHLARDDAKDAIDDFTQAIALDPLDPTAYRGRAQAYRRLGDGPRAADDERSAARLQPRPRPSPLSNP